ncbi:MAG: hypothetical protein ACOYNI_08245 [Acidimicrobiia bacterium]
MAEPVHVPEGVDPFAPLPAPITDPTLGIEVAPADTWRVPNHRLVGIGDSLTSGFASGAQTDGQWSYLAQAARALGTPVATPQFDLPGAPFGGVPVDLERLIRAAQEHFGDRIGLLEIPFVGVWLQRALDEHEEFWEQHPEEVLKGPGFIPKVLAVFGFTLRDVRAKNADTARAAFTPPKDNLLIEFPEHTEEIGTIRILDDARSADGTALTQVQAAKALGDGGIGTLVSFIGANDYLGAMTDLAVRWSDEDPAHPTAKTPADFIAELERYVAELDTIDANQVVLVTLPHVTVPPIAKGVGDRLSERSRYFEYYTRPWIDERSFNTKIDPHITGEEARVLDAAIDQVNAAIVAVVRRQREAGRDWRVLDACSLLDRVAQRRYLEDPATMERHGVEPYPLPDAIGVLDPVPNTNFYAANAEGRHDGGFFSLDGIHPTRIAHGILAQELLHAMGSDATIDFDPLVLDDPLIADPPALFDSALHRVAPFAKLFERGLKVFRREPVSLHRFERSGQQR